MRLGVVDAGVIEEYTQYRVVHPILCIFDLAESVPSFEGDKRHQQRRRGGRGVGGEDRGDGGGGDGGDSGGGGGFGGAGGGGGGGEVDYWWGLYEQVVPSSQRALSYSQMCQVRLEWSQRMQSSGGVMGPLQLDSAGGAGGSGGAGGDGGTTFGQSAI
ncbi:uncharacterized protein LOC131063801 [Cryptomeria japonica]|uniref:uncharacterized protein LOC131063801 n=1 Tax=Cryptomeria japonica TaxID=3369 RepID=UPI0027DA6148|nr:uncharacterized protein LOC131063801 [Cryptomeria japonica]